jgi:hypothetical protein
MGFLRSASWSCSFIPGEEPPGIHWIRDFSPVYIYIQIYVRSIIVLVLGGQLIAKRPFTVISGMVPLQCWSAGLCWWPTLHVNRTLCGTVLGSVDADTLYTNAVNQNNIHFMIKICHKSCRQKQHCSNPHYLLHLNMIVVIFVIRQIC